MPSAVRLRDDYSAKELRALARRSKDANQSRRLLSLAAVRDGMDRGAAAKIGGMDRQTLRDWVHRFNAFGPEGLFDNWTAGPKPRLSEEQRAQLAQIVEAGPDREKDGVVRRMRRMAKAHRQTRNHHIHRNARLGACRSAAMTFGISLHGRRNLVTIIHEIVRDKAACGGKDLALPFKQRLFFAGEATHSCDFSTAHGADDSGLCAAEEVTAALGPAEADVPDPIDHSYYLEKPRPGQLQLTGPDCLRLENSHQLFGRWEHAMQSRSMKTLEKFSSIHRPSRKIISIRGRISSLGESYGRSGRTRALRS